VKKRAPYLVTVDAADHRERRLLPAGRRPDRLADGEAIHLRHQQIGDDDVRPMLGEQLERARPVARGEHTDIEPAQQRVLGDDVLQRRSDEAIVVDDEDRGHSSP
jgi:hypothetical protein